jgi:hypothetical protein
MTEEEWFTATGLDYVVLGAASCLVQRRVRLLCCAFAHSVSRFALDVRTQTALELADRYAEGAVSDAERKAARKTIQELRLSLAPRSSRRANAVVYYALGKRASTDLSAAAAMAWEAVYNDPNERLRQVEIVRDVVGNPFRPVAFAPEWRTDTAIAIARGMYESRDFSPMPILADALQDAGCENAEVLNHCRDAEQVHVRGCWVVDLVLSKT